MSSSVWNHTTDINVYGKTPRECLYHTILTCMQNTNRQIYPLDLLQAQNTSPAFLQLTSMHHFASAASNCLMILCHLKRTGCTEIAE